jgi:hypothetical protein
MPDSDPTRQAEAGADLAEALRQTIERFRTLLRQPRSDRERRRIERLLAEAEAALSELDTPEEW